MKSDALFLRIDELAVESFPIDMPNPFDGTLMNVASTAPCVKETLQTLKTCGGETCGATCGIYACA